MTLVWPYTLAELTAELAELREREDALPADDHATRAEVRERAARVWQSLFMASDLDLDNADHVLLVNAAAVVARRYLDLALVSRVMAEDTPVP